MAYINYNDPSVDDSPFGTNGPNGTSMGQPGKLPLTDSNGNPIYYTPQQLNPTGTPQDTHTSNSGEIPWMTGPGTKDQASPSTGNNGIKYNRTGNSQTDWTNFVNAGGYSGAYGRSNMGSLVSQFNNDYGYNAIAGNNNASGQSDTASFDGGQSWVDLIHGGDNAWQWLLDGDSNKSGAPGAPSGPSGPYTPPTPFTPQARAGMPGAIYDPTDLQNKSNDLYQYLMDNAKGKITDANNPNLQIDPNNPIIKGQVDAADAKSQQSNTQYLQKLSESAGPNTNLSAEARAANESRSQNTASLQSTLMSNELAAQRTKIQQMLAGAAGMLSQQQQQALQEQLSRINLQEQQHQFDANLGERAWEFGVNDQFRNSPLGS